MQVVTADSFHACRLIERHATAQLQQNVASWERPAIQSIEAWLSSCWQDVRYGIPDTPILLSRWQELLLWREVIEADEENVFDAGSTAQLAWRAAGMVAEWHIPLDAPEWNDNADALRFREWHARFKRLCSRRRFCTRADLWSMVPAWIESGTYSSGEVTFWGFHVQSPAFRSLLDAMADRAHLEEANPPQTSTIADVVACEHFEQELEHAARWARAAFEMNSSESIAVFVPELRTHRSLVERTFKKIFYPASALQFETSGSPTSSAFHIAAAEALDAHPLIANALLLLELGKCDIALSDAGAILRCPFITGAARERSERAQADLFLRADRELEVSLRQMQRASRGCPLFAKMLQSVSQRTQACHPYQDFSAWRAFMSDLLQDVGWPGNSPLTSVEEVLDCWNSALTTLGTLNMVSGAVSYQGALAHLRRILSGPGVEVGDWSSPIQILDVKNAAGLEFRQAFATGLSEETWPAASPLSSLIPLQLQRACNVPCSSPQNVQEEQGRVASALFSSASTVVGTFSGRLSPFAAPYVRESFDALPQWTGKTPRQSFEVAELEAIADGDAPVFQTREDAKGGTGILKSQSLCPFRAFAEYRLHATFPDEACFGFDNLQRGGFLHKALEVVWRSLETQERLLSLTDAELKAAANDAVSQAIDLAGRSPLHRQATEVERERVAELLLDWLVNVERQRMQPFTVEKIEGERVFELGGLRLHLRIDRIDRLANGKLLLIDYKSGEPSRSYLDGTRPSEPQLLIYATALGREVDGVFFGQLKPRKLKAVGYSREQHFPGRAMGVCRDKWDDFLEKWQDCVEGLAREFVDGHAHVQPGKGACQFCRVTPLCRIHELANTGDEAGADDGE